MNDKTDNLNGDQDNDRLNSKSYPMQNFSNGNKVLELNFAEEDVINIHPSQLEMGPYVQSEAKDKPFRSRFKSWMKAVSLAVILVFVPEQASWAFNYNPLVLWGDKSSYPSKSVTRPQSDAPNSIISEQIANSINKLLNQVAYQDNARIKLELPNKSNSIDKNSSYNLLLENNNNFNESYISQITNWLRKSEIHPLNCGVYSLKDILDAYEIDVALEELSVTSLTVDLMSNIVKPGEKKLKTSLYSISKIINAYGLNYKNARLAPEDVIKLEPPFIASFKNEHFVTVTNIDENKIYYNDIGLPAYLSKDAFVSELSGFVLAKNLDAKKDLEIEYIPDSMAAFVWGDKWRDQSDDLPGLVSSSEEWSGVITTLVIIVVTWGIGYALQAAAEAAKAYQQLAELLKLLADILGAAETFSSIAAFAAAFNFSYGLSQFSNALATIYYLKCTEKGGSNCEDKAMYLNMAISIGGSLFKGAAMKVGADQAAAGTAKTAGLGETFKAIGGAMLRSLPKALATSLVSMGVQKLTADALSKLFLDENDEDDQLSVLEQAIVGVVAGLAGGLAAAGVSAVWDGIGNMVNGKTVASEEQAQQDLTSAQRMADAAAEARTSAYEAWSRANEQYNSNPTTENKVELDAAKLNLDIADMRLENANLSVSLANKNLILARAVVTQANAQKAADEAQTQTDRINTQRALTEAGDAVRVAEGEVAVAQAKLNLGVANLAVLEAQKTGDANAIRTANLARAEALAKLDVAEATLALTNARIVQGRAQAEFDRVSREGSGATQQDKIAAETRLKIANETLRAAGEQESRANINLAGVSDNVESNAARQSAYDADKNTRNQDSARTVQGIREDGERTAQAARRASEYGQWLEKNPEAGFLSRFFHALTMDTGGGTGIHRSPQSAQDRMLSSSGSEYQQWLDNGGYRESGFTQFLKFVSIRMSYAFSLQMNIALDQLLGIGIKLAFIEIYKKASKLLTGKEVELKQDSLALMVVESVVKGVVAWYKETKAEEFAQAQLAKDTRALPTDPVLARQEAQRRYDEYLKAAKERGFFSLLFDTGGDAGYNLARANNVMDPVDLRSSPGRLSGEAANQANPGLSGDARNTYFTEAVNAARNGNRSGLNAILFGGLIRFVVAQGLDRMEQSLIKGDRQGINQAERDQLAAFRAMSFLVLGSIQIGTDMIVDSIMANRRESAARGFLQAEVAAGRLSLNESQIDGLALAARNQQYSDLNQVKAACAGSADYSKCITDTLNNNAKERSLAGDLALRGFQEIFLPIYGMVVGIATLNGTDPWAMDQRLAYERGGATWSMSAEEITVRRENALMARWFQQADMGGIWGNPVRVSQFQRTREAIEERAKKRNEELIKLGYASEVKSDRDIANDVIVAMSDAINPWKTQGNYIFDSINSYMANYLVGENSPALRSIEGAITGLDVLMGGFTATEADVNSTMTALQQGAQESINKSNAGRLERGAEALTPEEEGRIKNITFVEAVLATNLVDPFNQEKGNITAFMRGIGMTVRAPVRMSIGEGEQRNTRLMSGHLGFIGRDRLTGLAEYDGLTFGADMVGAGAAGQWLVQEERNSAGTYQYIDLSRFTPNQKASIFGLTADTVGLRNGNNFQSIASIREQAAAGNFIFQTDKDGNLIDANGNPINETDRSLRPALLTDGNTQFVGGLGDNYVNYMNSKGITVQVNLGEVCNGSACFMVDFARTSTSVGRNKGLPDLFSMNFNNIVGSDAAAFAAAHEAYWTARNSGLSPDNAMLLGERAYANTRFLTNVRGFMLLGNWAADDAQQFAASQLENERLRRQKAGESFTLDEQRQFVREQFNNRYGGGDSVGSASGNQQIVKNGAMFNVFGESQFRSPGTAVLLNERQETGALFVGDTRALLRSTTSSGNTLPVNYGGSLASSIPAAAFQYATDAEGKPILTSNRTINPATTTSLNDYFSINQTISFYMNGVRQTNSAIAGLLSQHRLISGAIPNSNSDGLPTANPETRGLQLEQAEDVVRAMGLNDEVTDPATGMIGFARTLHKHGISVQTSLTAANFEEVYNQFGIRITSRSNQFLTAPISFNVGPGGVDLGSSMTVITRDLNGNILYRAQAIRPALAIAGNDPTAVAALRGQGLSDAFIQRVTSGDGMIATQVVLVDAINPNDPTVPRNADGTIDIQRVINNRAFYDVFILDKDGKQVTSNGDRAIYRIENFESAPGDRGVIRSSASVLEGSVLPFGTPLASRAIFTQGIIDPDKAYQSGMAGLQGTEGPALNSGDKVDSVFSLRYNPETDRVVRAGITQGFLGNNSTEAARKLFVTNTVYSTIAPYSRMPVSESGQNRSGEVRGEPTIAQALRPDPAGEAVINNLILLGLKDSGDQAYVEPFDFYGETAFQQSFGVKIGMGSVIRTSEIVRNSSGEFVRRDPVMGKNPFQQVYYNPITNSLFMDGEGRPVYGQVEQGTVYGIRPVRNRNERNEEAGPIVGAELIQPNDLNLGALALSLSGRTSTRVGEGASAIREAGYVAVANRGRPFVYDGGRKEWTTLDATNLGEAYVISQQDVVISNTTASERRLASSVSAETMAGEGLTSRREAYLALYSGIRRDGASGLMIFTPAERQSGQQNQILLSDAMGSISPMSIVSETTGAALTYHTLTGVIVAGSPGLERTIRSEDRVRNPEYERRKAAGESTEGIQEFITQADAMKNELRARTQATEPEQQPAETGTPNEALAKPIETDGTATITASTPGINIASGRFEMLLANNNLIPLTGNIKEGNLTVDPSNGNVTIGRLFNSTSREYNGRTETQGGTVWMTVNRLSKGGIIASGENAGRFVIRSESQGDFFNVEETVAAAISGTENATGFGAARVAAQPGTSSPSTRGFGIGEVRIVGTRTIKEGGLIVSARYFDGRIIASPEASMSMEAGEIIASRPNNTPADLRASSGPVYYTALGQAVDFIRGRAQEETSTFDLARVGDNNKLFIGTSNGVQVVRDYLDANKNVNPDAPQPPAEPRTTDSQDPGQTATVESLVPGGGRGLVLLRAGQQANSDAAEIKRNVLATDSDPRTEGEQPYNAGGVNTETALFYGITDQGLTFNEFMPNSNYFFKHEPNGAINRANPLVVSNNVSQAIATERGGGIAQVSQTNRLSTNTGGSIISIDPRGGSRYYNFTNQWSIYADNVRIVGDIIDDGRLMDFRDAGETLTNADGGFATYLNNPTGRVVSNYSQRGGLPQAVTYITGKNNVYLFRDRTG